MTSDGKKHPCPDCRHCQWCSDDRCRLCLKTCQRAKLSLAEQIELFDKLNSRPCQPEKQREPRKVPVPVNRNDD